MGSKTKTNMIRELIRLSLKEGKSTRECQDLLKISKSTVCEYVNRFKNSTLTLDDLERLTDEDLELYLSKGNKRGNTTQEVLYAFFPYVDKELRRTGVTLALLWEEYKVQNPSGVNYSRFCHYYRNWKVRKEVSMHQHYKAGEKLFVDFTGKKLPVIDNKTGEISEVEVFVAILGCSHYTYVEAIPSQRKADFISANQNALHFLGGVPKAIVPDCLKSAVIKSDLYEPEINSSYYDFAKHYGTTILPARALKPKDKSLVENMVKTVYTRIFAPLRNMQFFSIEELNEQIWELLDIHNDKQFQQKETSRSSLFKEIERAALQPLPVERYEFKSFHKVKVQYNHHVYLKKDMHYYSVPWEYTGKDLLIVYSGTFVEIYNGNVRIASHKRSLVRYEYTTDNNHRPVNHQFKEHFGYEKICKCASQIGPHTTAYMHKLIEKRTHPEQAYKSCLGILTISKKYENDVMEKACDMGHNLQIYSYKFINNTIKNGTYKTYNTTPEQTAKIINIHANIRGKESYK
jgi:transposase